MRFVAGLLFAQLARSLVAQPRAWAPRPVARALVRCAAAAPSEVATSTAASELKTEERVAKLFLRNTREREGESACPKTNELAPANK